MPVKKIISGIIVIGAAALMTISVVAATNSTGGANASYSGASAWVSSSTASDLYARATVYAGVHQVNDSNTGSYYASASVSSSSLPGNATSSMGISFDGDNEVAFASWPDIN